MQIKRRKNTISLIKATYSKDDKRCFGKTIATFPADIRHVPADLAEKLSNAELEKLEQLCQANRQHFEAARSEAAAVGLAETLRQVSQWYRQQRKSTELATLAESARDEWTAVLASMCAVGVGRTRRRRKLDN